MALRIRPSDRTRWGYSCERSPVSVFVSLPPHPFTSSIKMLQREQDLQVPRKSDSRPRVFPAHRTRWWRSADGVLQCKCPPRSCSGLRRKLTGAGNGAGAGQYVNLITMFLHCLGNRQMVASPDTQLDTRGGSLTCNYTQPRIYTHTYTLVEKCSAAARTLSYAPRETNLWVYVEHLLPSAHASEALNFYFILFFYMNQAREQN